VRDAQSKLNVWHLSGYQQIALAAVGLSCHDQRVNKLSFCGKSSSQPQRWRLL
jgi:hypothetical protein